ncbi:MAG: phytochelatin synthase family protein, partial [Synechococcaceae cyanobacterium]
MTRAPAAGQRATPGLALKLLAMLLLGFWGNASSGAPAPGAAPTAPWEAQVAAPATTAASATAAAPTAAGARPQGPGGGRGGVVDAPSPQRAAGPAPLELPSNQGQVLLFRSRQRSDYGPLSQEFLTQANLSYCGVASAVMALNSLAVPAPAAKGYASYRFWTQENLFEAGSGGPDATTVRQRGMTLAQLQQLLAGRGVTASAIEASSLSLAELRQLLRRSLADPDDRLLVNYHRQALGQAGGGHISPLAAFDDGSDRVLILDVARYRYPAVWVPISQLLQAMRGI